MEKKVQDKKNKQVSRRSESKRDVWLQATYSKRDDSHRAVGEERPTLVFSC